MFRYTNGRLYSYLYDLVFVKDISESELYVKQLSMIVQLDNKCCPKKKDKKRRELNIHFKKILYLVHGMKVHGLSSSWAHHFKEKCA